MKMQDELTYRLIYEMCKRILTLEDDLAAEQALNNSLINFDVVETKALNDAQKEYIRQQDERICKLEEIVVGLHWCSCGSCETDDGECPLHDLAEPDNCKEERLLRELGIEVQP